jgi:hypothetical protein
MSQIGLIINNIRSRIKSNPPLFNNLGTCFFLSTTVTFTSNPLSTDDFTHPCQQRRHSFQFLFSSPRGFPSILWEVLSSAGYPTPPLYTVLLYEEHRVPCCRVWPTLEAHPLQPDWCSLDSETIGFRSNDNTEAAAMKTLMTFCSYHPLEMVMHLLGLFPAKKRDDTMWCNRVSHVKDVWALKLE